jgi:hypothetical protein
MEFVAKHKVAIIVLVVIAAFLLVSWLAVALIEPGS